MDGHRDPGPVEARCPLRPKEPCTWCHPEAHGPQDCPTVALVMEDPELRERLVRFRARKPRGDDTSAYAASRELGADPPDWFLPRGSE
jgi:hypothetical protein